jgi:hypothetical protein
MIRTVADFLQDLANAEVARLNVVDVDHGPTIGDMYEGLSAELLRRAVPEQLGLRIVEGFISDGLGGRSGQIDCMLVRGEGEEIPYTHAYVWPVKDLVAVFEIKKTLYREDLVDAFKKLRSVRDLDRAYKASLGAQTGFVNIQSARRSFAETTGVVAPPYGDLERLSLNHQLIFHTLVSEQLSPVGIVLGYHGYASERAFRESLVSHIDQQINTHGYGAGSFPQLMISGQYSLGKANGQPYSARMHGQWWPFYFSSRVSPILLLLEYVWTRLDAEYRIGGLWGQDLTLERHNPFLLAQGVEQDGQLGWRYEWVSLAENELASGEDFEPWEPEYLSAEQFAVISWLCEGRRVGMDDPDLLRYLEQAGLVGEEFKESLLDTSLVAMAGNEFELITERCLPAILPDVGYVAGEDNSGRMSRWLEQYLDER